MIPLVDLRAQHDQVAEEVRRGWGDVLERASFVDGEEVEGFERAFAAFCAVRHCMSVGNGTDALEFAMRAVGIGPGDEVIVPANSFVASAMAVVRAGATPVLADIDPCSYLIDVNHAAALLGARTRAIMAVHLYGQVAPVEQLQERADGRVVMIEDAAQSHGARRHGVPAGGLGIVAATSFYPSKNLGAYGDAGAVLTHSDAIAGRVRSLRNHGSRIKHEHPELGFNSRLDTLQAVVLNAKLRRLGSWNAARREAASRYDHLLEDLEEVKRPTIVPGNEHVWHLYVIRVRRRNDVLRSLLENGIGAAIHYPIPIHLQGAFRHLGHEVGDFPAAEAAAREVISLPMFPEITPAQQDRVVDALRKALR